MAGSGKVRDALVRQVEKGERARRVKDLVGNFLDDRVKTINIRISDAYWGEKGLDPVTALSYCAQLSEVMALRDILVFDERQGDKAKAKLFSKPKTAGKNLPPEGEEE